MKIYDKIISEEKIDLIVDSVTKKKDLINLDSDFIKTHLKRFLEQNKPILDHIADSSVGKLHKSSMFKSAVKHIRDKARKVYGVFQTTDVGKRETLLEIYLRSGDDKDLIKLLNTHRSTRERIFYNDRLYKKIFSFTKKPQSILDLGSGLNPLTFQYMGISKNIRYTAVEFNQKDVDFLNLFFKKTGMKNSKAVKLDLADEGEIKKLKRYKADVCFIFKVLDSFEISQKNISYKIIQSINSDNIIVSFPLYSISGKKMRLQRRNWFEKLAERLDFHLQNFQIKEELFYILKKKSI